MRSGSEADSYVRLIDFVYQSTLGLRVIKKKKHLELRDVDRIAFLGPLHRDRVAH